MADARVSAAIDAIVDGKPMEWPLSDGRPASDTAALGVLRAVAAAGARVPHMNVEPSHARHSTPIVWCARLAIGLASLQIAAGVIGWAMGYSAPRSLPASGWFMELIGFAVAASWLMVGGARDPRAHALGGFYLVVSSTFGLRFFPTGTFVGALCASLSAQPFMPLFLWGFVSTFPRTARVSAADHICRWGLWLSAVIGPLLVVMKVVATFEGSVMLAAALRRYYGESGESGDFTWGLLYWAPSFALLLPPAFVLLAKRRLAPPLERRRATVFTFGFTVVLLLAAGAILLETFVPSFFAYVRVHRDVTGPMFLGGILVAPAVTTYAVLVDNVLDVRTALSRGARYLLARRALIAVSATPLGALIAFLYVHRTETIGEALSEGIGATLVVLTLAAALLTVLRDRVVQYLDTHFDRTGVNLANETAVLAAAIGNARTVRESADVVEAALARCLAITHVRTYQMSATRRSLDAVSGEWPSLTDAHALFAMLSADRGPVLADGSPADVRHLLPSGDRQWCTRTGVCMLVPVVGIADRTIGAIALGAKQNGDEFLRAEQTFVGTIASALALKWASLESSPLRAEHSAEDEVTLTCEACARVAPDRQGVCDCGGRLQPASIPRRLAGKFVVTNYVGAGAMGVVYRATDTMLGRPVALKTLGRLTGAAADRLAGEARIMAAVAHPNLATIYGVERWRSTPILVLEFLERGSLASRLRTPLPVDEVLRLGLLLAPALEQLHKARILHRDIKPTNIGFTRDDAPKLLDFGVASVLTESATDRPALATDAASSPSDATRTQAVWLGDRPLAGTPLYLPPEALDGASPSPAFDLWALSLVLFEAIAGTHPFAAASVPEVFARIRRSERLDLRRYRPECPPDVADVFGRLLAPVPAERCGSAGELRAVLEGLLEYKAAPPAVLPRTT